MTTNPLMLLRRITALDGVDPEHMLAAAVFIYAIDDARQGDEDAARFLAGHGLYDYWASWLTTGPVDLDTLQQLLAGMVNS